MNVFFPVASRGLDIRLTSSLESEKESAEDESSSLLSQLIKNRAGAGLGGEPEITVSGKVAVCVSLAAGTGLVGEYVGLVGE